MGFFLQIPWLAHIARECTLLLLEVAEKWGAPPWAAIGPQDNNPHVGSREKKVCVTLEGGRAGLGKTKNTGVGGR